MEHVIFSISGNNFGIPVSQIREVLKRPPLSPLPMAPGFIEGVITLRRHSLAVIDLKKRLYEISATTEHDLPPYVIVVRINKMIIGFLVDQVIGFLDIGKHQIDQAVTLVGKHLDNKAVSGIAHVNDQSIILLNIDSLLNIDECGALLETK